MVERSFNNHKQWHGIATRYDKLQSSTEAASYSVPSRSGFAKKEPLPSAFQTRIGSFTTTKGQFAVPNMRLPEGAGEGDADPTDELPPDATHWDEITLEPGQTAEIRTGSGAGLRAADAIPFAEWRACGLFDSRYKLVHKYNRGAYHPRMLGDEIAFRCGRATDDGAQRRFGYRHVAAGHMGDWQRRAAVVGENWRDLAGWAMDITAQDPDTVFNQSPKRFCFDREFGFFVDGEKVGYFRAVLILGETGRRVMTLIPAGGSYKCIKATTPPGDILFSIPPRV